MNNLSFLRRLEYEGVAMYIDPDTPDWFVPSSRTDDLLQTIECYDHIGAAVAAFRVCWAGTGMRVIRAEPVTFMSGP